MIKIKKLVSLSLAATCVYTAMASAGPKEFNEAMTRGDHKAAAAETLDIWESYDQNSVGAVTLAREFAFVNFLAGNYEQAASFIGQLTGDNAALADKDDQPAISRVLAAVIKYRQNAGKSERAQLANAIDQRLQMEGADSISIIAAEVLYSGDWSESNLRDAIGSATMAVELLERVGSSTLARQRKAELLAQVSEFLLQRDKRHYEAMADLHDKIVEDVDGSPDESQRDELIQLKWISQAWVNSIEALFTSYYSQLGSNINRDIKPRELKYSRFGNFYERAYSTNALPLCEAEIDKGKLRYPGSQAFKGTVGSVIVKIDFDEDGKASNPTVLAAVPLEKFSESVLKAAPTFRLKPGKGQDLSACQLERKNNIISITFLIR